MILSRIPIIIGILVVVVVGIAAGAHITSSSLDSTHVSAGDTSVESSALEITGYAFTYAGNDVTEIDVTIENTESSTIDAEVRIVLTHDGSTVGEGTQSATWSDGATETVTVSISTSPHITDIEDIDITVVET